MVFGVKDAKGAKDAKRLLLPASATVTTSNYNPPRFHVYIHERYDFREGMQDRVLQKARSRNIGV
jgi:hypothetical protein